MKKSNLMPTVVLASICLAATLLLSVINLFTSPIIKDREDAKANAALVEIYPGGSGFEKIDITKYTLPKSITAAYSEGSGGYVIQSTVSGYNQGLVIMCGVDKDGKIVGADYIASSETLSAEVGLGDRFVGKAQGDLTPDIVAGSTAKLTTSAYYQAITDSLNAFIILTGGEADLRTPEEILEDNCNTALGTSKIKFTKWFKCESVVGVDAVYEAENDGGRVYVIGDSFVGVKDGAVTTADATEENKAAALAADSVISASTLEDITTSLDAFKDALATEKNAKITKAYKTASGNLLFEMEANGHAVKGDHGNGTPIKIKIAISKDGKIIDVVTVSHAESKGYGDKCATDEYYEQYRGKGDDEIKVSAGSYAGYTDDYISADTTDVGAIASATNTTLGYQKAVKLAFKAFELLIGGNE